jgi:hypothetical protein
MMSTSSRKPKGKGKGNISQKSRRDWSASGSVAVNGLGNAKGKVVYKKNMPLASSKRTVARQPKVNGERTFRCSHSEYLADLTATAPLFNALSYSINPGLSSSFPWLSSLAKSFDQYRIVSLSARFESSSNATQDGRVFLAFDYDPSDPPPATKGELMSYLGASSNSVWDDCRIVFSGPRKGKTFYVRSGGVVGDIRLWDAGNLIVSTSGVPNGLLCGEIYLDYEIDLINPQGAVACAAEEYQAALMTQGAPVPLETPLISANSSSPLFCVIDDGVHFTINTPGNYLVSCYTSMTAGTPSSASYFNMAVTSGTSSVGGVGYGWNTAVPGLTQIFSIDQTSVSAQYSIASNVLTGLVGVNQFYVTPAPG